jgi:hypothetical protein
MPAQVVTPNETHGLGRSPEPVEILSSNCKPWRQTPAGLFFIVMPEYHLLLDVPLAAEELL